MSDQRIVMQARWNGAVLAESDETVVIEGNHYFPCESLADGSFVASDHTSVCPWKGKAAYYTVVANGKSNPDAAWYYDHPKPEAAQITGRVAFWKGVEVAPAAR